MDGVYSTQFGQTGKVYSILLIFSISILPLHENSYSSLSALFAPSDLVASNCLLLLIRVMFCITTRTHRAKEMRTEIRRAADDIKALLLLQQQIVEGTKFHLA